MGGKHRRLIGGAEMFVDDTIEAFRIAAVKLMRPERFDADALKSEQNRLRQRLDQFGSCADARDIWRIEGVVDPDAVPGMTSEEFIALADKIREPRHDAR
jgi:malonate decarboxylase beta subunit